MGKGWGWGLFLMTDFLSTLLTEFATAAFLLAMLIGLFGMVIPIFPGGVVIWLAALVYGLLFGISGWGWVFFIIITLLMIAGIVSDDLLMATSARKHGATWGSLAFAYLGGIGGTYFTPIINWPEVAILGVSRGTIEPVWKDGKFEPVQRLPLSLSYDHRVIDGADAMRFLRWVVEMVEQPFLLSLVG